MKTLKNNILLSFVLPIYNVEAYLQECVESILQQMTEECEIILVDDGSPDNCPQICDEFAKEDQRVIVVHKENGGLSSARNAGLSVAKGEYITFVDSDDKIHSDSVVKILEWIKAGGTDMCFLKAEKAHPNGTRTDLGECIVREQLHMRSREEAIVHLASRPKYPGSAWGKLFRREFLLKNDLHFPYDRRYSEDLGFIRDCILCADTFDALDVPYYQYRQNRQGSITNKMTSRNFYDLFRFIDESVEKMTTDKKHNDFISKSAMSFVAYEYSVLLYLYNRLPKEDKKAAIDKLKKFSWTLKYAGNKRGKMCFLICKLLGIRCTIFIIKHYKRTVK